MPYNVFFAVENQGLVIKSTGMWYEIKTDSNQVVKARLKGKHKLFNLKVTNPIAVGDRVRYFMEEDGSATITEVLERDNYIIRKSTHKTAHGHLLAANLDLAVVIATLYSPRTSTGFIDRFLVTAQACEVPAMIIFNKLDLYGEEALSVLEELKQIYLAAQYSVLAVSALSAQDVALVRKAFAGKTVLLSGHSGVGKSTLLNALIGKELQKTSKISDFADKGVHTTTFAEMFELDDGTKLIDTPGIKELGIIDLQNENLDFYFPEFRNLTPNCKYHNCLHINEPGCAVVQAFQLGQIPQSRYLSYVSILEGSDNRK